MAFKIIIFITLLAWYGFFLVRPIDITHGDLGRHLKNGEIILSEGLAKARPLLTTNFYSSTNQDFPFVNHHWGSGVIFYIVWAMSGFLGLQAFAIFLSTSAFVLFYAFGVKRAGFWIATAVTFFLIPLLADRRDIRPELFTYVFLGIFLWILDRYRNNSQNFRLLFLIPLIFLVWVNMHIYFIFGLALIGIYFLDACFRKENKQIKMLAGVGVLCLLFGAINPFGIKIFTYPFNIFNNYGITVQENLSMFKATANELDPARAEIFKISFFLFWILIAAIRFYFKKLPRIIEILLALLFGFLGWQMIRNLTLYALFYAPLLAIVLREAWQGVREKNPKFKPARAHLILLAVVVVGSSLLINESRLPTAWRSWGYGILPGSQNAVNFLQQHAVSGNLFNDYDSGSYAIFYLFPYLRPFVDNRPEAYPAQFLETVYATARADEDTWQKIKTKYGLNALLLSLTNKSTSAIPFIIRRVQDPLWAPVYADDHFIVFITRTKEHREIIRRFEIPKSRFTVVTK